MFWFKKKKTPSAVPTRAALIAQAQANARKARAEIGEETIQKIAAQFQEEMEKKDKQKQKRTIDEAKELIRTLDKDRVADHLRYMIKEEK